MNLKQFNYLSSLEPYRQRLILAAMVLNHLKLLEKATELVGNDVELQKLTDKINELNLRPDPPEVEGLNRTLVLTTEVLEILDIERKLDSFIWQANQEKNLLTKLRNRLLEKIINLGQK